jgi:hypothetical protein
VSITILPLLRVLRVLRIIKLVPKAKGLRLMLATLTWSLPALVNIGGVLLFIMYIYVSRPPRDTRQVDPHACCLDLTLDQSTSLNI